MEKYLNKLPIKGENITVAREAFLGVEGHASQHYFKEYMKQFPEWLKPKTRTNYKTKDPLNNLLNLGLELLKRDKRIVCVRRNNSKITKIRTAIKEEASLLVKYLKNTESTLNFIKEEFRKK